MEGTEEYCRKFIQAGEIAFDQPDTMKEFIDLANYSRRLGTYFKESDDLKEAGYYQIKALDMYQKIYDKTGSVDILEKLSDMYDIVVANRLSLGLDEEARTFRAKARALSDEFAKIEGLRGD